MRDCASVPDGVDEKGQPFWAFDSLDAVEAFLDAERKRKEEL